MYNKEKVLQQNIERGVYVGIDVASILISGGTLMYVRAAGQTISKLQKTLLILDIANGAINIAVNVTELSENEDVQTILFVYNLGTAGFNLACSTKNINWLRKGGQVLKGTENISETLILRLSKYDETKRIGFFKDFGENKNILNQLDNFSDAEFDKLMMQHYDVKLAKEKRIANFVEEVKKAGRKLDLLTEEALGGHSIARHGHQLSLTEMEQRVLGTHPTIPQSRSALRFETMVIHEDAVNKAFSHYADEIESFFNNIKNDYGEWTFDYGTKVGSGYTNTGTLKNPASSPVFSNKVTISFKRDANSPRGYRLESAFPDIR